MTTPISLQTWILLVLAIGVPVHLALNKGLAHWREHGEISSILTMTLVMITANLVMPLIRSGAPAPRDAAIQLLFSLIAGFLFGAPIGLIFRMMVRGEARPPRSH